MLKGIPDEISRLLEHEKKLIQLYHENQQNSQTGANVIKKKGEKIRKNQKSGKKIQIFFPKEKKKNYTLKSLVD